MEKPGRRDSGNARTSITALDPGSFKRCDKVGHDRPFITDRENAHGVDLGADCRHCEPLAMADTFDIHIIGGGLAGSEASWQLAEAGYRVRLSEMRGSGDSTPAHESDAARRTGLLEQLSQ